VAVVGMGGVGMAAMLTALAHDDVRVIAVDQVPDKLDRALAMGAHAAYHPDRVGEERAAVVIEAAGHPSALETAIGLTAPGGRTVTVGLPRPDARISLSPLGFVAEGRSLIGSYLGSAVRRAVAIRPASGGVAGVVDDRAGADQRRHGPTGRRGSGAADHRLWLDQLV
jgi:Zn-dependent alcohol dehydrogenase